ncbi:MAG: glycoside hydrolase family 88 protein [Ruminococcus sp.]|nr:glycoside hydrolase family 88 protein [Ruminococcus sp.]
MTGSNKTERTARDYIDKLILTSDPLRPKWNRENFIFRKEPKWNYMDSCIIRALLMYSRKRPELTGYAVRFVNSYVTPDGRIPTAVKEDFNLDNICGGRNLLALSDITGDKRYIAAAESLIRQLDEQPRLSCGSFWHKSIYPDQMWLDGAYMALPFLAAYGIYTGDSAYTRDALAQLKNIRSIMRDDKTGLYYHGYCETRDKCWCDSETGLSPNFWLRANGWLCAGLADIYEITGDSSCAEMLAELLTSLQACQTGDGMLLQLPALPELGGNYPETSGTLLFAYAAMKAHRLGAASAEIAASARLALNTVTSRFISYVGDVPVLRNICLMAGLGGIDDRDGSAEYYLSERRVENDAKGIAPYLMAAAEASLSE